MFKLILFVPIMFLVSFSASFAADDSIKVVPGNYSITTTTKSNMSPNPQIETEEQCITDTSFNPGMAIPDEGCSTSNVKKSGNTLAFDIKCTGGEMMPPMTGKAEASTTSSTLSYLIKMVGSFQGREFSINSKSEGKRTGDCK